MQGRVSHKGRDLFLWERVNPIKHHVSINTLFVFIACVAFIANALFQLDLYLICQMYQLGTLNDFIVTTLIWFATYLKLSFRFFFFFFHRIFQATFSQFSQEYFLCKLQIKCKFLSTLSVWLLNWSQSFGIAFTQRRIILKLN